MLYQFIKRRNFLDREQFLAGGRGMLMQAHTHQAIYPPTQTKASPPRPSTQTPKHQTPTP